MKEVVFYALIDQAEVGPRVDWSEIVSEPRVYFSSILGYIAILPIKTGRLIVYCDVDSGRCRMDKESVAYDPLPFDAVESADELINSALIAALGVMVENKPSLGSAEAPEPYSIMDQLYWVESLRTFDKLSDALYQKFG